MDLIGVALLLVVAVVGMLVLFFDALGRVLVGAVAALARAPWQALTRRRSTAGRRDGLRGQLPSSRAG